MANFVAKVRIVWVRLKAAWRVMRHGEVAPSVQVVAAGAPIGKHRVTREYPLGTIIDTLYQGTGAIAGQTYERYNAERDGEWICYYRHNERCSAKPWGGA